MVLLTERHLSRGILVARVITIGNAGGQRSNGSGKRSSRKSTYNDYQQYRHNHGRRILGIAITCNKYHNIFKNSNIDDHITESHRSEPCAAAANHPRTCYNRSVIRSSFRNGIGALAGSGKRRTPAKGPETTSIEISRASIMSEWAFRRVDWRIEHAGAA